MQTTSASTQALAMASRSSGMILTDRLITYRQSFKIMLGLILILVFGSPGVRAQNFTYSTGINQYKVADDAHFATTDPRIVLTMDCLAANGYGQWTCSNAIGSHVEPTSNQWLFSPNQYAANPVIGSGNDWNMSTTPQGWFLLPNILTKPSETDNTGSPGCQPPGVVSGGEFNTTYPTTPKVAANLGGRVRYVWVEPTNLITFKVEGFNDERGATIAEQQINITLGGLPNPAINRQIIQSLVFNYPTGGGDVTTLDAGSVTHIVDNGEADKRDEFDIAMDQKYLYIVWNSGGSIYAKAILLSDGSTATTTFFVAGGTRPTVACDVRANPTTPAFAVAFINGNVKVGEFIGNAVQHGGIETMPQSFNDPATTGMIDVYTCRPTHARVLVSSLESTSTHIVSVYVRECDELLLYDALTWIPLSDNGWYVDGNRPYHCAGSDPLPSPIPQNTGGHFNCGGGIADVPIIAFANPYDGNSTAYDQFFCLYQLEIFNNGTNTENPLILIQSAYNIFGNNPHGNLAESRLLLNQETIGFALVVDDPASYCGAVNQMGIHIHWRTASGATIDPSTHFYVRASKNFDEDIEEHTLVTNVCQVSSPGAQLLNGVKMTLWSDPNYGAVDGGSTTSGMYWQYPGGTADGIFLAGVNIGTLIYASTGLVLQVGDGTATANLFTMPLCSIGGSTGAITINNGSTWDYFGSSVRANWNFNYLTVNLNGPSSGSATTPNLNIHGGAVFWECPSFNASQARIDILYEAAIAPISSLSAACSSPVSSVNCDTSGLWRIGSTALISNTRVNSFHPQRSWQDDEWGDNATVGKMVNVTILITTVNAHESSSVYTLHSTNSFYTNFASLADVATNTSGGGGSLILYDGNPHCTDNPAPDKVVFDGDVLTRIRFHAMAPGKAGLELINLAINDIDLYPINIDGSCTSDYKDILVENNTFGNVLYSGGEPPDPAIGILIQNLNKSDRFGELNVNYNTFTHTGDEVAGLMEAAIQFVNSTGNIMHNKITEDIFQTGITITNSVVGTIIKPYLCNNFISGLASCTAAIESDHYAGYIKLCQIAGCAVGYESDADDNPSIVATSILNSTDEGIFILGAGATSPAKVDLTGVHSDPSCTSSCDDYAAFDTITGTTVAYHSQVLLQDQYQKVDYGKMVGTWVNYGENNTMGTTDIKSLGSAVVDMGNFDHNYWNGGDAVVSNLTFNGGTNTSLFRTTETAWSGSISCGGSYTIKPKGNNVLSLTMPMDIDTCTFFKSYEYYKPETNQEYKDQYDTLRLYIERCAAKDDQSWDAFTTISAAVQFMSDDTARFAPFRSWLISVLYLNKANPAYFCACMGSIAGTYQYGNYRPLGGLAVMNYLRQNHPECWSVGGQKDYTKDSMYAAGQTYYGGYTVNNLPPLDSLGLGFLLKSGVTPTPSLAGQYLASFTSSPNPFTAETKLNFALNRMAYVTIEVYDLLGNKVFGNAGKSYEAGSYEINLDGNSLPSGTLYARISTGFGEVKTVKLVHEK